MQSTSIHKFNRIRLFSKETGKTEFIFSKYQRKTAVFLTIHSLRTMFFQALQQLPSPTLFSLLKDLCSPMLLNVF